MKKEIGRVNALYPIPTVIVGTKADGKPTFMAIAHIGIIDLNTVSISSGKKHFSNQWILKNRTLSINIPSEDMLEKTDLVGSVSGWNTDKSKLFSVSEGSLPGVPLIDEAPVSMECKVIDVYDRPNHNIFICSVEKTYAKEDVLTDGKLDFAKIRPVLYDMPTFGYWGVGKRIGYAHRLREKILEFLKKNRLKQ